MGNTVAKTIFDWANRHGVSLEAVHELLSICDPTRTSIDSGRVGSEAAVQADLRIVAARNGVALWRNNNGALPDETGRVVRYGLGNDSTRINEHFKSSDLIGIWPQVVTADMIGQIIGRFIAVDVKKPGWRKPSNKREIAQANFLGHVQAMGGIGLFAQDVKDVFNV